MKKFLTNALNFLERKNISVMGLLLILFGIGGGFYIFDEEQRRFQESAMVGSGLVCGFSILAGALLQISRDHRK